MRLNARARATTKREDYVLLGTSDCSYYGLLPLHTGINKEMRYTLKQIRNKSGIKSSSLLRYDPGKCLSKDTVTIGRAIKHAKKV
ncbi:hypothetical protein NDU88_007307 [Pleurodeles waltl]|uniref:Uncharacterized protein n=1 Tax=Pleurodeles waltl TaxID=8319 RepID=A0AAV7VTF9_PLEWA|nr:hypothetical protein NDU88_007307 [Pleurodeles waltl]